MLPLNAFDFMIVKKYILGVTTGADGSPTVYGEVFDEAAVKKVIEGERKKLIAKQVEEAKSKRDADAKAAPEPIKPGEPRVEELPSDEDEAKGYITKRNRFVINV